MSNARLTSKGRAICLALAMCVASAQGAESPAEDAADDENSEIDPTERESAKSDKKGTDGVFLPSEEISEDFAVSFPVDI